MEDLIIEKTLNTPYVNFNPETGIMRIEGRSIPEDPGLFYNVLFNWLEKYYQNPKDITKVEMKLEYVNSGSSKYILGLFSILKRKYNEGINCEINWYYEEDDEALYDLGDHFRRSIKVPFNLIEFV